MADYWPIGRGKLVTAVADTGSGLNAGNYTATFDTSSLKTVPIFELYHFTIDGPVGFALSVYDGQAKWGHTAQGWQNEWNGEMLLEAGNTLYFYFSAPAGAVPVPTVVLWFRYDMSLRANQFTGR
jgi:hypothetical protein